MRIRRGRWNFRGGEVTVPCVEEMWQEDPAQASAGLSHGSVLRRDVWFSDAVKYNNGSFLKIIWDGRLDNRTELARQVSLSPDRCGDEEIIAAAYRQWGTKAFAELIGDWSLVVWDPRDHALLLARDPIGLRPLYYAFSEQGLEWSNSLDALLLGALPEQQLNLEYIAGWLSLFPKSDLTPYSGIRAVPPSAFTRVQPGRMTVHTYWNFDPAKSIRLTDDAEYEEQFRSHFANAVRRRLRSARPLLAELSGGMDSSSIVCVADRLLAHENGLTPRLDTISYYNDSEPNWNERPYFSAVEAQRGQCGHHVPIDAKEELQALFTYAGPAAVPAECGEHSERNRDLAGLMDTQSYGAILSGIGGDEFTGGVPTAIPELGDLLASFRLGPLTRQTMAWALAQRKPWTHLLLNTLRAFLPPSFVGNSTATRIPAWVCPRFAHRYRDALRGYQHRLMFSGARPSFQENLSTLDAIRRQLGGSAPSTCEKRFPYLDRDLLEFLFAIPRQQIIKPGRRRFLMRQSLAGIVPDAILTRKRKAYVTQSPRMALAALWPAVLEITTDMHSESLGIISSGLFRQALEDLRAGKAAAIVPLFRTLTLECWLRNLGNRRWVRNPVIPQHDGGIPERVQSVFS